MSTWNLFIPADGPVGLKNLETAPLSGSKWPPRAVHSLELPNLAARGAHFEPTVWIPRVESRAENFPQYRQYGPLTPPINRISVEDLGEEKIGSKVSQKTSIFAQFLQISSFTSNAGLHRCNHRKHTVILSHRPPSQPAAATPTLPGTKHFLSTATRFAPFVAVHFLAFHCSSEI